MTRAACIALWLTTFAVACHEQDDWIERCLAEDEQAVPSEQAPMLGDASAEFEIDLFGDLSCPYTRTMLVALTGYLEKVAAECRSHQTVVRYHHLPRIAGGSGEAAALIAIQAEEISPGSFWGAPGTPDGFVWCTLADTWSEETVYGCASQLGLSPTDIETAIQSDTGRRILADERRLAHSHGIEGTPGILICGQHASSDPTRLIANLDRLLCR